MYKYKNMIPRCSNLKRTIAQKSHCGLNCWDLWILRLLYEDISDTVPRDKYISRLTFKSGYIANCTLKKYRML